MSFAEEESLRYTCTTTGFISRCFVYCGVFILYILTRSCGGLIWVWPSFEPFILVFTHYLSHGDCRMQLIIM